MKANMKATEKIDRVTNIIVAGIQLLFIIGICWYFDVFKNTPMRGLILLGVGLIVLIGWAWVVEKFVLMIPNFKKWHNEFYFYKIDEKRWTLPIKGMLVQGLIMFIAMLPVFIGIIVTTPKQLPKVYKKGDVVVIKGFDTGTDVIKDKTIAVIDEVSDIKGIYTVVSKYGENTYKGETYSKLLSYPISESRIYGKIKTIEDRHYDEFFKYIGPFNIVKE